jgi:uncharacterized membrane protein YfcA
VSFAGVSLLAMSVVAGAGTQRVTGLGFALVSSPLLVLVAGPFNGVLLANVLSLTVNLVVLAMTWREVEVRRALLLLAPALCLVPVGAYVARHLRPPVLLVLIGALVVIALVAVLASDRARVFRGPGGAAVAGALSGFMNVTAGVGGPAMALHAVSTDWDHRRFVPSVQLYSAGLNLGSIAAKGLPHVPGSTLLVLLTALTGGIVVGNVLARRVSPGQARRAVVALALLGGLATMVKGVLTW